MGNPHYSIGTTRCHVQAQLARWQENLIDLEVGVADARADLERAVDALHAAVRERDRAAHHLAHLLEHYEEQLTGVSTNSAIAVHS